MTKEKLAKYAEIDIDKYNISVLLKSRKNAAILMHESYMSIDMREKFIDYINKCNESIKDILGV